MSEGSELVITGCIDCGAVKASGKDALDEAHPAFEFGSLALRMWRDMDGKHYMIMVSTKPERVFLSCQPFAKLTSEDGIAACLNFTERIKPEQEIRNV